MTPTANREPSYSRYSQAGSSRLHLDRCASSFFIWLNTLSRLKELQNLPYSLMLLCDHYVIYKASYVTRLNITEQALHIIA